jgi:hypothetical protein
MTDDRSPNYRLEDASDALSFSQRGAKRQRASIYRPWERQ